MSDHVDHLVLARDAVTVTVKIPAMPRLTLTEWSLAGRTDRSTVGVVHGLLASREHHGQHEG